MESERLSACLEKLARTDWKGRWDKPMKPAEILAAAREVFEPLFHEPPVGPIPDYLDPHWSVHGCVAEYEDRLDQLDRWKAVALGRWLKEHTGRRCCVAGRTYELRAETEDDPSADQFSFRVVEEGVNLPRAGHANGETQGLSR